MTYNLQIKEEANLEIFEAYLYYEEQQLGLGERFIVHLEKYFKILIENPFIFSIKPSSFREAFLQKFPYLIVYEVIDLDIIVYSVFNTNRNPDNKTGS